MDRRFRERREERRGEERRGEEREEREERRIRNLELVGTLNFSWSWLSFLSEEEQKKKSGIVEE